MPLPDPAAQSTLENRALLLLLVLITVAFGWVLLPFFGAILWGAVIALLFRPVFGTLLRRMHSRRTLAALLTMLLVGLIVILPMALITAALAREAARLYQRLQTGALDPVRYFRGLFDALPDVVTRLLDRFGLVDFDVLQQRLTAALAQASQFLATQAFGLGQITFDLAANLLITLYLAFFLIRDGDRLAHAVRRALPLAAAHQRVLAEKFSTVIRATVRGNLLVAAIQGALGGLAFWWLDVGGALLWAVLMAFLSLLPAVGAALVWAPVALYFFANGAVGSGLALSAWGVLVIGLVDNLLRPLLVGKDTGMSDALVMITTLGGIAVFGLNGFILGPVIAAMFISAWHLYAPDSDDAPAA